MYRIIYESEYNAETLYFRQFQNKAEAILAAKHLIEDGIRSYYHKKVTCRIYSILHPDEVIVVRENNTHTYKIPKKK